MAAGRASARAKNDREAMEKLARDVDTAQEPPEALFVLVWGLQQRGASAAALALCAVPRKHARRTSGSTTNSGWRLVIASRRSMKKPHDS